MLIYRKALVSAKSLIHLLLIFHHFLREEVSFTRHKTLQALIIN